MKRCCLVTVEVCSAVGLALLRLRSQQYRSGTTFRSRSCRAETAILKSFDGERVKSLLNMEYVLREGAIDFLPIYSRADQLLEISVYT